MYIGQRTQAWQPVYCFRPRILHQVVLHRAILLFDDAEVFVISFGVIIDYFSNHACFQLFCSLIKSVKHLAKGHLSSDVQAMLFSALIGSQRLIISHC